MRIDLILAIVISFLLLIACSDDKEKDKNKTSGDHVWKEQTDTMDRARAVEGALEDAAKEQREMIEENIQ